MYPYELQDYLPTRVTKFHVVQFVLHVSGTAEEAEKSEAWC